MSNQEVEAVCGDCEQFKSCEKELWVNMYTPQQSVAGCLRGDKNIREEEVDEEKVD